MGRHPPSAPSSSSPSDRESADPAPPRCENRSAAFPQRDAIVTETVKTILTAVVIGILVGVPPGVGEDPASMLAIHLAEDAPVPGALGVGSAFLIAWVSGVISSRRC